MARFVIVANVMAAAKDKEHHRPASGVDLGFETLMNLEEYFCTQAERCWYIINV